MYGPKTSEDLWLEVMLDVRSCFGFKLLDSQTLLSNIPMPGRVALSMPQGVGSSMPWLTWITWIFSIFVLANAVEDRVCLKSFFFFARHFQEPGLDQESSCVSSTCIGSRSNSLLQHKMSANGEACFFAHLFRAACLFCARPLVTQGGGGGCRCNERCLRKLCTTDCSAFDACGEWT